MAAAKAAAAVVVMLVAMCILSLVEAQQCNNYMALSGCVSAVNTNRGYPGSNCCTQVSKFQSNPSCLCSTMIAAKNAGIPMSIPNALTIPGRCGYGNQIPKNFVCAGYKVGQ